MDKNIDQYLVINALLMAVYQRKPKAEVIVQRIQGSSDCLSFMKEHKLVLSMSHADD